MLNIEIYSIGVFVILLISGCIVNLLKHHYIIQLTGISILFSFIIIRTIQVFHKYSDLTLKELYVVSLPVLSGISACLISMVIGFWFFPVIRRRFKN
jgi:hypothetical protein